MNVRQWHWYKVVQRRWKATFDIVRECFPVLPNRYDEWESWARQETWDRVGWICYIAMCTTLIRRHILVTLRNRFAVANIWSFNVLGVFFQLLRLLFTSSTASIPIVLRIPLWLSFAQLWILVMQPWTIRLSSGTTVSACHQYRLAVPGSTLGCTLFFLFMWDPATWPAALPWYKLSGWLGVKHQFSPPPMNVYGKLRSDVSQNILCSSPLP